MVEVSTGKLTEAQIAEIKAQQEYAASFDIIFKGVVNGLKQRSKKQNGHEFDTKGTVTGEMIPGVGELEYSGFDLTFKSKKPSLHYYRLYMHAPSKMIMFYKFKVNPYDPQHPIIDTLRGQDAIKDPNFQPTVRKVFKGYKSV